MRSASTATAVLSLLLLSTTLTARSQVPLLYPSLAQSVLLTDAVAKGAACLDGSPQRYWIQKAQSTANASKWSVHMMGGGWCESTASCASRAFSYIGSSNTAYFTTTSDSMPGVSNYSDVMDFAYLPSCLGARWCGGLMANDTVHNPVSSDWNKVLISYCDGGSFGGANMNVTPAVSGGKPVDLHYRGFYNLNAVIDDLLANRGLASATDLILSGDSAGGLAVYWHVDHWASRVPSARVVGAPDSGYFFTKGANYPAWQTQLLWVVNAMNSSAGLNQACVAAEGAAGRDPMMCAFPEVVSPYIKSPLFVLNGRFDPALDSISGGISGNNPTAVQALGDQLLAHVQATVLNRPGNAAFLTSCAQHCGQWSQGWILGPPRSPHQFDDYNVTLTSGVSSMAAFEQWWTAGAGGAKPPATLWMQDKSFPCASCCKGGNT